MANINMSILKNIHDNSYQITDEDLEQLVSVKVKSESVDNTLTDDYFRVLIRRSKDAEGTDEERVTEAHKGMMKVVNKAVITRDIAPNPNDSSEKKAEKTAERQRRTGFARSSASVLRRFLKSGGHLDDLDPAVHGKSMVEKLAREQEQDIAESKGENTPEGKVLKRLASLITALGQIEDMATLVRLQGECACQIRAVTVGGAEQEAA